MEICYSEDHPDGTANQLVYVVKDFNPDTELMIVVPFDSDDGVFKQPVRFVFDGHNFPFKIPENEIIEAIGAGAWEKAKVRMAAVETLLRQYCTVHPDVALTPFGCVRCEMQADLERDEQESGFRRGAGF